MLLWIALLAVASSAPPNDLGRLGWLAGTWTGSKDGVWTEEHWSTPAGGGLMGMHKDAKDGRMTSYEFFRIVPDDAGRVCYMASPLGRSPVPFRAVEVSDHRVVFENREHDFPQRILYWRDNDVLHARIEGRIKGEEQSEEWAWQRAQ